LLTQIAYRSFLGVDDQILLGLLGSHDRALVTAAGSYGVREELLELVGEARLIPTRFPARLEFIPEGESEGVPVVEVPLADLGQEGLVSRGLIEHVAKRGLNLESVLGNRGYLLGHQSASCPFERGLL